MKVILFQDLIRTNRSSEDIIKIIGDTGAEMLFRSASRVSKTGLHGDNYTRLVNHIIKIKSKFPNIKIIGNLYFQLMSRSEMDDITLQSWTEQETYDQLSFDPSKFGITSINKCEYNCKTGCTCKGPGEAKTGWYIPDITIPIVQDFFVHQAQRLLDAGCDGIWIDGLFFNAKFVRSSSGSNINIQRCIDASLYVCEQIRKLKTLDKQIPLISSWFTSINIKNLQSSPYWRSKFFDFITINSPNREEMKIISPIRNYDKMVIDIKNYYGNVPIISYIDWWWGKSDLWYFSQWYPEYTTCCNVADSLANREKRHRFQVSVLRKFTDLFKSKGISWAYPVYGGGMCGIVSCDQEDRGSCCVKGSLEGNYPTFYDSQSPEFNTYDEIVRLMKTTPGSKNRSGIIILSGFGLLLGLVILKREKKKIKR